MNVAIELHDSNLVAIEERDGMVVVRLEPAYIHKSDGVPGFDRGTGWVQFAKMEIQSACIEGEYPNHEERIMDGTLVIGCDEHVNIVPIPLNLSNAVIRLCIKINELYSFVISGSGIRVELLGSPRFIEEFCP